VRRISAWVRWRPCWWHRRRGLVCVMGAVDAGDAGVFIESRWWVASISVAVGVVGAWLVEDVPAAAVLFLVAAGIGAGMALVGFIALRKGLAT
jgi:hypothetical protein